MTAEFMHYFFLNALVLTGRIRARGSVLVVDGKCPHGATSIVTSSQDAEPLSIFKG